MNESNWENVMENDVQKPTEEQYKKQKYLDKFGVKHSDYSYSILENFVFVFWVFISLAVVYFLDTNKQWLHYFSEVNKVIQPWIFIFSRINATPLFDSELANAHFLIMMLSIPAQLFMLFMVPNSMIAPGVQKKGERWLFGVIFIFSLLILIVLAFGPVVPAKYSRILGERVVVALTYYAISIGISYLIRVVSIVIYNITKGKKC